MAKHIVLEIIDREVAYLVYESIEAAIATLRGAFEEICEDNNLDQENECECWIDESGTVAYANTKNFNYDWEIISVK